jgi:hypothetical protein
MRAHDKHPAILVKDAILARSGIYLYSRDEIWRMGFTPVEDKPLYKVYRPPHVLVEAKDKFAFAVVTKEHPVDDTSPDNFRDQAEGCVGDDIAVVALEGSNIGLRGKIAFYTQDVADYFERGNKETSAQYGLKLQESKDPVRDGYDFVMTEITSVNGLAITARGRGGSSVRVLDSIARNRAAGGYTMKKGFLAFLGVGKSKDAGFKFSEVLLGSMAKVKALDAADTAGIDREVTDVMAYVAALGESEAREVLAGAVADCYKNIEAVLARKDEVSVKLDELYGKCQDADTEAVRRILGAGKDSKAGEDGDAKEKEEDGKAAAAKEKDKKDGAGKDARLPDFDTLIGAAVDKAFARVNDSIDAKIDAVMKKALGGTAGVKPAVDSRPANAADSGAGNEDASYLVRGVFGNR